jgi:DNA-directed RNA polymerase specialized sigma24 family protein
LPPEHLRERPLTSTFLPGDADRREAAVAVEKTEQAARADWSIDELAAAATAGDTEAVGQLYDRLLTPVYRYIAVRVRRREDAEDITQLVFERIVSSLPRYRHAGKPFTAFAFRIARTAVVDHQRRRRRHQPLEDDRERARVTARALGRSRDTTR